MDNFNREAFRSFRITQVFKLERNSKLPGNRSKFVVRDYFALKMYLLETSKSSLLPKQVSAQIIRVVIDM